MTVFSTGSVSVFKSTNDNLHFLELFLHCKSWLLSSTLFVIIESSRLQKLPKLMNEFIVEEETNGHCMHFVELQINAGTGLN